MKKKGLSSNLRVGYFQGTARQTPHPGFRAKRSSRATG
jgi:hypothetical protein